MGKWKLNKSLCNDDFKSDKLLSNILLIKLHLPNFVAEELFRNGIIKPAAGCWLIKLTDTAPLQLKYTAFLISKVR